METLYSSQELKPEDLKDLIKFFDSSNFIEENKYYNAENTGIDDYVTKMKNKAANSKRARVDYTVLKSSFYKKIANQAANYIVGDDVSITGLQDKPVIDINKFIQPAATIAAKNGRAWVHFYIKGDKLNFKLMNNTELIPVYDTEYEDTLRYIIRFYTMQDGTQKRTRVEVWDNKKVSYYLEDKDGEFYLDYLTSQEPIQPHMTTIFTVMGTPTEVVENSWGRPPFFELKYNLDRESELGAVKCWIDAYDKVVSGFVDNVDDIREAILLIKDRSGDVLSEVMDKIDKYKALFVEDSGDASYLTVELPVEAREILKKEFRACIYEFADGVDMSAFKSGGNITNVYIQAMFQALDAKSTGFTKMLDEFILEVLEAFNIFLGIMGKPVENLDDVIINYNKTIPSNIDERIASVNSSKGVISDKTIYENHPLVDDVEEELLRVDDEVITLESSMGGGLNGEGDSKNIRDTGSQNGGSSGNPGDEPKE